MLDSSNHVWVTSATHDDHVVGALMVCFSLRRSYTNCKISIVISTKISTKLRQAVLQTFDFVFYLDDDANTTNLSLDEFAKVFTIASLNAFCQGVYLAPTSLVFKNFDDIFEHQTNDIIIPDGTSDVSFFLFKPTLKNFASLRKHLVSSEELDLRISILNWKNKFYNNTETLGLNYNHQITNGKLLAENEDDLRVIDLLDYAKESRIACLKKIGFLENLVADYWLKIFYEDVFPILGLGELFETPETYAVNCPAKISYNEPIAIVGMSCRFPKSNNLEEFWNLLFEGEDGTGTPPPYRWKKNQSHRQVPASKSTNAGFLSVPVDEFDGKFFGISPKEVLFLDPQHRLLHEIVWEGLEDACIDPHTLRGTSGSVFVGSWINDYREILMNSGNSEFYRLYMGNSIGACAARLSFLLGMTGPSIATESGCSSAMVAVHMACQNLRLGVTNMALACGVNMLLHPFEGEDLPMVISPDGHSKTFSEDADGFARAEGAGVLVLKKLSDAIRNGDHIWGLITGSAVSQEGLSKSMGTPTVQSESLAMTLALKNANISPEDVSYVEAHGTGTAVGDPMEVAAIAKAYHTPNRRTPLIIGSVKTNVGHTESCSGITGIIKVILSMQNEVIPAHKNFTKLNPSIDLDAIPAILPLERIKWKKCSKPRVAGVSSFGITGTDAHVLVQESPYQPISSSALTICEATKRKQNYHIVKISTKTEEAMSLLLDKYAEFLNSTSEDFNDICYSANTGRANFSVRSVFVCKNKMEFAEQIRTKQYTKGDVERPTNSKKICFLFTGQGSQYPEMAKELYRSSPVFRIHFDFCAQILLNKFNINVCEALWTPTNSLDISRTVFSQTSIFCVEYSLLKLWNSWGVKPHYVLGHSLGEFAAAVCAGLINVEAALELVAERSLLIDSLPHGKMLAIKESKQNIEIYFNQRKQASVEVPDYAAFNSNHQTVVAGSTRVIEEFETFCINNGIKCLNLNSTHAFHSRQMDPILKKYSEAARRINSTYKTCKRFCGYISGMHGEVIDDTTELDSEYWVQQTRNPVQFQLACRKAAELGCNIFLEVGPQPVLSALTLTNVDLPLLCLPSLRKHENNWKTMYSSLAQLYTSGVNVNWSGLSQFLTRKKVKLPHYPFVRKRFWPRLDHFESNALHPLIGSLVPNATGLKIFQSKINTKTHEWIKDHTVGNNVVFPGAAYVEMCISAGIAATQSSSHTISMPCYPVKVENLCISAPLAFMEEKSVLLQTVVQFNDVSESTTDRAIVKIFQRISTDGDDGCWISHAKGEFSLSVGSQDITSASEINKNDFIPEHQCNKELVDTIYPKLSLIGLNFGPIFQSIAHFWKIGDNGFAQIKVPNAEIKPYNQTYATHPVIIDAMIQAIMLYKMSENGIKKLHVPIKIGKFIWFKCCTPSLKLYIKVTENCVDSKLSGSLSTDSCMAILFTEKGEKVASMEKIEFIETTVRAINAVLEQHCYPMADLWEEVWRQQVGPCEETFKLESLPIKLLDDEMKQLKTYEECPDHIANTLRGLEKFVYLNMLKGLYGCGWTPELMDKFYEKELMAKLNINKQYKQQFGYFLRVFEEEGILKQDGIPNQDGNRLWHVIHQPPTREEVEREVIKQHFTVDLVEKFRPILLMAKVGNHLGDILKGSQSVLGILFPEKSDEPSAAEFYVEYGKLLNFEPLLEHVDKMWLKRYKAIEGENCGVFRILEVGAGTGGYTQVAMRILEDCNIKFEYTYTDISAAFFVAAEKRFAKWSSQIKFKKLNIEEDPLTQGFIPGYYDYICASDVIHATKSLRDTLGNVLSLLKPGGFFVLCEQTRVNRFITYLFGLLEGFWRFEDFDVRQDHCIVSKETWSHVLKQTGFEIVGVHSSALGFQGCFKGRRSLDLKSMRNFSSQLSLKVWLVFHESDNVTSTHVLNTMRQLATHRKIIEVTRGNDVLKCQNDSYYELPGDSEKCFQNLITMFEKQGTEIEGIVYCWSLKQILPENVCQKSLLPFFFLTKCLRFLKKGASPRICALVQDAAPIPEKDLSGFYSGILVGYMKSLQNERADLKCKVIDIGTQHTHLDALQIFYEIWNAEKNLFVCYQGQCRYISKLNCLKVQDDKLELPPGVDRFQLILPDTKSIQDLKFGHLAVPDLDPFEVEVEIRASALNFRDIMNIMKPSNDFKDSHAVGFDFAGKVKRKGSKVEKWKIGDRVFGVNLENNALPSHIKLNENHLLKIPDSLTFCEASTLPAVANTSYHCLIEVAKIQPGDKVLIHTASGGVGLSAIELCKHVGATIFATAGSARKQKYLRALGIQYIFCSRNTKFCDEILRHTNGKGVDVVLNSLTGPGFKEASLRACANGARFVEMSKLSVWSVDEVKSLRPDVSYTLVDLTVFYKASWKEMLHKLNTILRDKIVSPVPYVRFDAVHIREALTYLQKARQIGKVVCVLPEFKLQDGKRIVHTPIFHDNATYLITGGLGGIGWQICIWMLENGAKYVILAGRTAPNFEMKNKILEINVKYESKVITVMLDVSNFEQCQNLISYTLRMVKFPALKGVMHAAGILSDSIIENHTLESFSSTFSAKVNGTINLHEITKNMSGLEHFVTFSSAAALFGPPGQSNHAAGNYFEDAVAHYRHSIGLPATTINWGQWGEVGVATEVVVPGVKPFSTRQAILALEFALKHQRTQTGVVNIESIALLGKLLPFLPSYLDERVWKSSASLDCTFNSSDLSPEQFWKNYDNAKDMDDKVNVMKVTLKTILRRILKLEATEQIDDNGNFQEMGVDSLMFVEIKNALQSLLGDRVTVNANVLKDSNSLNLLSYTLIQVIEGTNFEMQAPASPDEVQKLIEEDSILPDSIKVGSNQKRIMSNEISRVLLTGVTGTLGRYVLNELVNLNQIKEIVCLIRPLKKCSPKERLELIVQELGLKESAAYDKIKCVSGNVADASLGLEEKTWIELSNNLHAVVHCAAKVQHYEQYMKRDSKSDTRGVNVEGLKHVLEFACTGNILKHVYCASSMLSIPRINEVGNVSEDWPEKEDFKGVTLIGYPVSKFVGDLIMKEAVLERGIPGKVFRFPLLVGDSKTGKFVPEQNHMMLRYFFILKMGIMPSNPSPIPMLPVDICAKVSTRLFFDPNVSNDIFNICNKDPVMDQEFVNVAMKLGYRVNVVDFAEFAKKIRESSTKDNPFAIFKEFYINDENIMSLYSTAPVLKHWLLDGAKREDFFVSTKIRQHLPEFYDTKETSMDCIYRDLLYAKNNGWFTKYIL